MSFLYLPDKANVVVDALRHLSMGSVSHVEETKRNIVRDVHRFAHLGVRIEDSPNSSVVVNHNIESSLVVEVKSKQHLDPQLMELKKSVLGKMNESFSQEGDGVLRFQGILCVPNIDILRNRILEEAHGARYTFHLGSSKMYHDLIEVFL